MKVLCSVSSTTDASWFIHFMRCLEGIKTTCSWMLVYTSWRHKRKFVQFALDLFDGTISRENAPVDAGSGDSTCRFPRRASLVGGLLFL